jgi:hypothetical protein
VTLFVSLRGRAVRAGEEISVASTHNVAPSFVQATHCLLQAGDGSRWDYMTTLDRRDWRDHRDGPGHDSDQGFHTQALCFQQIASCLPSRDLTASAVQSPRSCRLRHTVRLLAHVDVGLRKGSSTPPVKASDSSSSTSNSTVATTFSTYKMASNKHDTGSGLGLVCHCAYLCCCDDVVVL